MQKPNVLKTSALICLLAMVVLGCEINAPETHTSNEKPESGDSKSNSISLIVNKWADGEIVKLKNDKVDEQWFRFVATASTQRVYVKLNTLTDMYFYLYDSNFDRVGSDFGLSGSTGKIGYTEYSLNIGLTYYIKVTGRNSNYTGKYWIGFTDFPAQPETVVTKLTMNTWTNGSIIDSNSGGTGEQWFTFKATASIQHIYVKLSTCTYLYAYLYDSSFNQIGQRVNFQGSSGKVNYTTRNLNVGETYYIKIADAYNGTYWIGFTDFPAQPETVIMSLSENTWANGNIIHPDSGGTGEEWFKFVAPASTQYIYIKLSTITYLNAYLYDDNYNRIGSELNVQGSSGKVGYSSWSVKPGATYYIKVSGEYYGSYRTGTYWIAFNSTGTAPQ